MNDLVILLLVLAGFVAIGLALASEPSELDCWLRHFFGGEPE